MGVVFSNSEDFANVRIYSGSAPGSNAIGSVSSSKLISKSLPL